MNFNSIWLKNRLYNSQIELFSFDLAIEYLVDAFLFYPFARSQYKIKAFGDSRGEGNVVPTRAKALVRRTGSFHRVKRSVSPLEMNSFMA